MTRWLRRAVVAVLVATALAAATAVPAQAAAAITVTPKGPYTNGAEVTVAGTGFTPGSTVVVGQCRGTSAPSSPQDCADVSTGALVYVNADAQGAVSATLTVVVGPIRDGVTCTGTSCSIVAFALGDPAQVAVVPFGTSGAAATSVPTSTSTPSTGSSPTPATSPTPTPTATSPQTTASAPITTAAAPRRANSKGSLARTGPDEAGRIAILALLAGQVGLVLVVRAATGRRGRHA